MLEGVEVEGFRVLPERAGADLPLALRPDGGVLTSFPLVVADCARARATSELTVLLRVDGTVERRRPSAEVSQPQPGGVTTRELLGRLVAQSC